MLLNSLTDWGNIRCWYRDTIRRYLQVIANSPFFIGLIFNQLIGVHIMLSFVSYDSPDWRTEQLSHHDPFLAATHRRIFCFFDFPTRQKCPEKTRNLRKAWCRFGSLAFFWGFWTWELANPIFPGGSRLVFFFGGTLWPWAHRTWKTYTDTWWMMNEEYLALILTSLFPFRSKIHPQCLNYSLCWWSRSTNG